MAGMCKRIVQSPGTAGRVVRLGFTLLELLIVIGTIALLLSILMPTLGKVKSTALRVKCAHNLRQINLAMNLYLDGNEQTYPCAQDPVSPSVWLWMGCGWRSFVEPYLDIKINKYNPSVLLCPQDRTDPNRYESTSYAYSMSFYHSPEQIDAMSSTTDQWQTAQPSVAQRSCSVAKPSGKILIGEWFSNHLRIDDGKDPGWWGPKGCRNFLFADGQLRFLKAERIRRANDDNPNPNLTIHGIKGFDWPQ